MRKGQKRMIKSEENVKLKGVDISEFQGDVDFKKLKEDVDFVIIRATFGRFGVDKKFERNVKECLKHGVPFGFYYYSYAVDEKTGKEEANFFVKTTKEYLNKCSFPCFIDMEDDVYKKEHGNPTGEILTNICINAIEIITNEKVLAGIYANKTYFDKILQKDKLQNVIKWLAWWSNKAEEVINKNEFVMLQYSSKGNVAGIQGKVDLNFAFCDFVRLKEYLESIAKIQTIKLMTGLNDLNMQYLSCYKWGKFLIDKIYQRLLKEKIKRETLDMVKLKNVIKKEYGLEEKTIDFISYFIHSDFVFEALYNAISN